MSDNKTKDNFLNGKKAIKHNINFGIKDKDLWQWAKLIPTGRFSLIIKDMIRAYYTNDSSYRFPKYNSDEQLDIKKPFRKSISIGKNDYDVFKHIEHIEENMVSYKIKEIIRYYLSNKKNIRSIDDFNNIKRDKEKETFTSEDVNLKEEKIKKEQKKQKEDTNHILKFVNSYK